MPAMSKLAHLTPWWGPSFANRAFPGGPHPGQRIGHSRLQWRAVRPGLSRRRGSQPHRLPCRGLGVRWLVRSGCSGDGVCKLTIGANTVVGALFNPLVGTQSPQEEKCIVPRLVGEKLRVSRKELSAARCSLGSVSKRRPKRHTRRPRQLLVVSSSPREGATLPAGSAVNLTLGPKSQKARHRSGG